MKSKKENVCKKEEVIFPSWREGKKKVVCYEGKIIHFGAKGYEDFTQHKDKERKRLFRKRMGCDPVNKLDKSKAKYWACEKLW